MMVDDDILDRLWGIFVDGLLSAGKSQKLRLSGCGLMRNEMASELSNSDVKKAICLAIYHR